MKNKQTKQCLDFMHHSKIDFKNFPRFCCLFCSLCICLKFHDIIKNRAEDEGKAVDEKSKPLSIVFSSNALRNSE